MDHFFFALKIGGRTCPTMEKTETPNMVVLNKLFQFLDLSFGIIDERSWHKQLP